MKHFPASRAHARIEGVEHASAPGIHTQSRVLWFVIGFFSACALCGYVAGICHWPN